MAIKDTQTLKSNLAATFDDGGEATALEFRQFMTDVIDSNENLSTPYAASAVGEILAFGITINTSSATAFLPISNATKATALIINGSFELFSRQTGQIATGLTAANLGIIQSRSSNRIVSVNITGLATTGGREFELRAASADASIKVVF